MEPSGDVSRIRINSSPTIICCVAGPAWKPSVFSRTYVTTRLTIGVVLLSRTKCATASMSQVTFTAFPCWSRIAPTYQSFGFVIFSMRSSTEQLHGIRLADYFRLLLIGEKMKSLLRTFLVLRTTPAANCQIGIPAGISAGKEPVIIAAFGTMRTGSSKISGVTERCIPVAATLIAIHISTLLPGRIWEAGSACDFFESQPIADSAFKRVDAQSEIRIGSMAHV